MSKCQRLYAKFVLFTFKCLPYNPSSPKCSIHIWNAVSESRNILIIQNRQYKYVHAYLCTYKLSSPVEIRNLICSSGQVCETYLFFNICFQSYQSVRIAVSCSVHYTLPWKQKLHCHFGSVNNLILWMMKWTERRAYSLSLSSNEMHYLIK